MTEQDHNVEQGNENLNTTPPEGTLMFERFLEPGKQSPPDWFADDEEYERYQQAKEAVFKIYGVTS